MKLKTSEYFALLANAVNTDEENYLIDTWLQDGLASALTGLVKRRRRLKREQYRLAKRAQSVREAYDLSINEDLSIDPADLVPNLTEREKRIWLMKSQGYSCREIGEAIDRDERVVRNALDAITLKYYNVHRDDR